MSCSAEIVVIEHSDIDTIRISPALPSMALLSGFGGGMVVCGGGSVSMTITGGRVSIGGRDLSSIIAEEKRAKEARASGAAAAASPELPKISLVLREGCKVRNIIFDGAQGEVSLESGSVITGSITNGVEK